MNTFLLIIIVVAIGLFFITRNKENFDNNIKKGHPFLACGINSNFINKEKNNMFLADSHCKKYYGNDWIQAPDGSSMGPSPIRGRCVGKCIRKN